MNDLATALREDSGLWLAFQPKICLHSGRPVALEALIRWYHQVRAELSPALFVPPWQSRLRCSATSRPGSRTGLSAA